MSRTDSIVRRSGEPVLLERVVDFEIAPDGQVSEVETELEVVKAVISDPTEKDEHRHEGRLSVGSLRLTLPSDTDVSGDRDGQRDRIYRPPPTGWGEAGWGDGGWGGAPATARRYRVVEARDDRNPLTNTSKLTILVDEDGGRVPLPAEKVPKNEEEEDEDEDDEVTETGWGEAGWGEGTWGGTVV